jgi:acyl dehydratase
VPIDYYSLKARKFPPIQQTYTHRDTMLYALGLNIGADPLDEKQLAYVAADPPRVLSTMASTLGRLGPWMRDPDVGINYRRIVVGEVALRTHRPLAPADTVEAHHSIVRITDKGAGRGALVTVVRELRNSQGELIAEFEQTTFCRDEGGFSAASGVHDPAVAPAPGPFDARKPDRTVVLPTARQQALIYRLSGDYNPLHSDPATARAAGFERPILHGLATFGMAGYALCQLADERGAGEPASMSVRFSAPVFPGDMIAFDFWIDGRVVHFQARNPSTDVLVLRNGRAELGES